MTTPITPDERVTLRALADAATEGPWEATQDKRWGAIASGPDAVIYAYTAHASTCEGCDCGGHGAADIEIRAEDAEFIAAARTAVPRLLDALDTADAEVAQLREQRDKWFEDESAEREAAETEVVFLRTRIRKARNQRDEARAEVARLREEAARPAPVWDEGTEFEAVARALRDAGLVEVVAVHEGYGAEEVVHSHLRPVVDAVRAVVREHLPVRPDREAVRLAQHRALMPQVMSIFAAAGGTQADYDALLDTLAGAMLTAWPSMSRATVQAEALRDAADTIERYAQRTDVRLTEHAIAESGGPHVLREYADRLDPKEK